MSAESIEQLADLLGLEETIYNELREVLQAERELMLSLDADGLGELAQRKQALASEGRIAERSRIDVTNRLAAALGIGAEPVTLRLLCAQLGVEGTRLREAQTRLVALLGAVRELADANRVLGGERLNSVQSTLTMLGRLVPVAADGDAYGRGSTAGRLGQLVRTSA